MLRPLLTSLLAMTALATPATVAAADVPVVADPAALQVAALDRTLVWVSGGFGHETLMQRTPDGTVTTVRRTSQAARYATIDLGRDEDGRLVLTYERCASSANASCKFLRDDLDGRRSSFRGLAAANCELSTAPPWRGRAAYGLLCRKGSSMDSARSGLYVKQRGHAPRQLSLKQRVVRFGPTNVTAVDLRGMRVAALAAGGAAQVALTESVAGRACARSSPRTPRATSDTAPAARGSARAPRCGP